MKVTDEMLERWNALRVRAGEEPITRQIAERVLAKVDPQTRKEILERIQ